MSAPREIVLLAGENEAQAIARRVKMHEFLMSGGVRQGSDKHGRAIYSGPITVEDYEDCPFHQDPNCIAWLEIKAGRGEWTALEAKLEGMKWDYKVDPDDELKFDIEQLEIQLASRPKGALELRTRTPEQVESDQRPAKSARELFQAKAAEAKKAAQALSRASHDPLWSNAATGQAWCDRHFIGDERSHTRIPANRGVCVVCEPSADTKPKKTGNPWMTAEAPTYKSGPVTFTGSQYTKPKGPDARDDAFAAFATDATVPDTIEFDSDEEEGEETP